jgi:hypothetical protein
MHVMPDSGADAGVETLTAEPNCRADGRTGPDLTVIPVI